MKPWMNAATETKSFRYPDDVANVEKFVDDYYLHELTSCEDVCKALEKKYLNLKAVLVSADAKEDDSHYACLVEGNGGCGCDLIDPLGDELLHLHPSKLRCAAFHKNSNAFASIDYRPLIDCRSLDSQNSLKDYLGARILILDS